MISQLILKLRLLFCSMNITQIFLVHSVQTKTTFFAYFILAVNKAYKMIHVYLVDMDYYL